MVAAARDRKHLFINRAPETQKYRSPSGGGPKKRRVRDRAAHGGKLRGDLASIRAAVDSQSVADDERIHDDPQGIYVEFESDPDWPLETDRFRNAKDGVELVALRTVATNGGLVERATVFVRDGSIETFLQKVAVYSAAGTKKGEKNNAAMLDPVAAIRLATILSFWTESASAPPEIHEIRWFEIWLRWDDGRELSRFEAFAKRKALILSKHRLRFDDRLVVLVRASLSQLAECLPLLNDLAEVRLARETPSFFQRLTRKERAEWIQDLAVRVTPASAESPAVCILDTGVAAGHPLLQSSLEPADCHAVEVGWRPDDHHGHGTEMAGLALYGDLVEGLVSAESIRLSHRLESVKILPQRGVNDAALYGAITASAAATVEFVQPFRARVFSMAVTDVTGSQRGEPSSWSSVIDALCAGRGVIDSKDGITYLTEDSERFARFFAVSAGNVANPVEDYLCVSDTSPIQDPAQAWNDSHSRRLHRKNVHFCGGLSWISCSCAVR